MALTALGDKLKNKTLISNFRKTEACASDQFHRPRQSPLRPKWESTRYYVYVFMYIFIKPVVQFDRKVNSS